MFSVLKILFTIELDSGLTKTVGNDWMAHLHESEIFGVYEEGLDFEPANGRAGNIQGCCSITRGTLPMPRYQLETAAKLNRAL